MKKEIHFKKDQYRSARGDYSRFLEVSCENCGGFLAVYQKDGPGTLRRMYLDRIVSPKINSKKEFSCSKCKKIIGTFSRYARENRLAIRLYQDAVIKKVVAREKVSRYLKNKE